MFKISAFFSKTNKKISKRAPLLTNQKGNIFFALFGAVAIVGLLGTAVVSTMRGPLKTMVEVQSRTLAESEMAIASRLALLESTELAAGGDCDGDGFVEPLEFLDAGVADAPIGGGFLPNAVASSRSDPWGTNYGYCAWDAGSIADDILCDLGGNGNNERLDGNLDPSDETYTVIAIISAGPDQVFDTTCTGGALPSIAKTGDDIITEFTYASAAASTGGLWNIKSGDPATAQISKNIEVTGGAAFTAGIDLTGSTAALQLGAASMLFPDETTLAVCNGANEGLVRINTAADPDVLQLCDDPTGWVSIGGGMWAQGAGDDIYYNSGTFQVGIGTNTPSEALDVVGNIAATGNITSGGNLIATGNLSGVDLAATGNATVGGTLGVTGATTLSSTLDVTGAATLSSTLGVTGAATLSSTLDVTGATTLGSTLDAQGDISNSSGSVTVNDSLVVTGTTDLQGNVSSSVGDLTLDDAVDITGNLDAQGTISNSTGNVAINDSTDVTGTITASADIIASGDVNAGSTINVNGDQLGPALNCNSAEKLEWNNGSGWSCVVDLNTGSSGTPPTLDELTDVVVPAPTDGDCVVYDLATTSWINAPCAAGSGLGIFELSPTNTVRTKDSAAPWDTSDFVFGSPQLDYDSDADHNSRMFFDKSKSAFRAGLAWQDRWDEASVGEFSAAFGRATIASGIYSFATGYENKARGEMSIALGNYNTTSAWNSVALGTRLNVSGYHSVSIGEENNDNSQDFTYFLGRDLSASGADSISHIKMALGRKVNVAGSHAMAIGLGNAAGAAPSVSGDSSIGIFMGDQSAVDITTANTMAVMGGKFILDPNIPATELAASVGGEQDLELDIEGDIGAIYYCDELGNDCFTADDVVNGGIWTDLTGGRIHYGSTGVEQVGIGTANPQTTLDVAGGVRVGSVSGGAAPSFMNLDDLGDVTAGSPADGECLTYDNGSGDWVNSSCASGSDLGKWSDGADAGDIHYSGGNVGIGTNNPDVSLQIAGTDAVLLPVGTAAQQPDAPSEGMIRYNSDNDVFEGYVDDGTPEWEPINTGAGGMWTDLTGGRIHFGNAGTEQVGIRTNNPVVALDIAGTARVGDGGEICNATIEGAFRYRTAIGIEYCDGVVWKAVAVAGPGVVLAINLPNKLDMDVTGPGNPAQGLNVVFSISNTGSVISNALSYTVNNLVNFVITSDTCTGVTLAPQTSCQIEITPQTTSDSIHYGTLSIPHHNNPQATLQGSGTGFGCYVGQAANGGIIAKCDAYGAGLHLVITPGNCDGSLVEPTCDGGADTVKKIWSGESVALGSLISNSIAGDQNTVNLINLARPIGLYPAIEYCNNLIYQGYNDWYLPASQEWIDNITPNRVVIGGLKNAEYWSSRKLHEDTNEACYVKPDGTSYCGDGTSSNGSGGSGYEEVWDSNYVRCARKEGVALPPAQTDTEPNKFTFATKFQTNSGVRTSSDIITIEGITPSVSVSVAGSGTPKIKINGGAEVNNGVVNWGDTIQIIADSPAANNRNVTTVTVGTTVTLFSIITEGNCGGSCAGVDKRVFVTSSLYNGNLGGLAGADAKCQTLGNAAYSGGTWKAIISGIATSDYAAHRMDYNWDRLININGDVVATGAIDLWDGLLSNPIAYDENGNFRSIGVISNMTPSGASEQTTSDQACNDWTTSINGPDLSIGTSSSTASTWAYSQHKNDSCDDTSYALYCQEVNTASAVDDNPDAFSFATKFATTAGARTSSDVITITGITDGINFSIAGTGSPMVKVNGGAEAASGTVDSGDTVQLVVDSPAANTRNTITITVGMATVEFSVITEGDCGGSCAGVDKRVFVTSAAYNGNLGGLAGADVKCQTAGDATYSGGTWKAIISGITISDYAVNRMDYNWDRLINMNGDVVATSPTDLWDGSITNAIAYDENNNYTNNYVFSNTSSNGNAIITTSTSDSCYVWTNTTSNRPLTGQSSATGIQWVENGTVNRCSDTATRLYCQEVNTASAVDDNPDAFSFATKFATTAGARTSSDVITITGITDGINFSIAGTGSPMVKVNGGAEAASGTVDSGDTIQLVVDSPAINSRNEINLTVGTDTEGFSVITEGDCGGSCAGVDKRVFVTSSAYRPASGFSSVAMADAKCQLGADTASLGGTWKAIISSYNTDDWAINRMDYNWERLVNMNGDVVATSPTDLWNGTLTNPIGYNEFGASRSVYVHTGTSLNGSVLATDSNSLLHCKGWTYTSNGHGYAAHSGNTANWTGSILHGDLCGKTYSFFCAEVNISTTTLELTPTSQSLMDVTGPGSPAYGTNVTFTAANTGTGPSAVLTASLSSSLNFEVLNDTCTGNTLAGGANCTFDVRPLASADGTYSSTITITDGVANDNSGLSGTATGFASTAAIWLKGADDDIYYNDGANPNVGIGTNNPTYPLHVASTANTMLRIQGNGSTNGYTGMLFTTTSDRHISYLRSIVTTSSGWSSGNFGFYTKTDRNVFSPVQTMTLTGDVGTGNGGRLGIMDTTPDASLEIVPFGATAKILMLSSTAAGNGDLLTVTTSGHLGIGETNPNVELDVVGDIEYTGTITDVSDRRLKDNIMPLNNTGSLLERINSIDTYSFTMKDDETGRIEYGVMAQELETIFPELVHTASDQMGTKSVNYVGLIAPMIEATKEVSAKNTALKSEITNLKAAQATTHASLAEISAQVALLNKVVGNNGGQKASMANYMMLLLGLLGGIGGMLIVQRKKKNA